MILVLAATARADTPDLDRYPLVADVVLTGPARVHVPLELRSLDDPADGTDLLLVDGRGQAVPFARLRGNTGGRDPVAVGVAATTDPTRYVLTPSGRADELDVRLPDGVPTATVTVLRHGGEALPAVLVWHLDDGVQQRVELPGLAAPFEVRVEPTTPGLLARQAPSFAAFRALGPGVPDERRDVDVGYPHLQENGWARWVALVEPALRWRGAVVHTPDPQLERAASLSSLPWHDPGAFTTAWEEMPQQTGVLRRRTLRTGEVAEQLELSFVGEPSDHVALWVDCNQRTVPQVDGLTLELDGVQLVVLDPGPEPHRLYAGAAPGTSPRWDLGAASELAEGVDAVVEPGPSRDNPDWRAPEERADLVEPGPPLDPADFRWQRQVTGTGLVRLALPPEVLKEVRPGLPDVRLVSGGRQVPFVVRPSLHEVKLDGVTTDREERGGTTRLRVHLPEENLPVVWLTLSSPAEVFDREVVVSRPGAQGPEPVRVLDWLGDGRQERLTVEVPGPVDRELLVEIRNGDNPPLPLGDLVAVTGGRELVAVLPADGDTMLWYGSSSVQAPSYDLSRLSPLDLVQRARGTAELGPAEPTRPPPLSAFHRVLLGVGIGVFALGLLALVVDTLRRVPADAGPAEPASS